MVKSLQRKEGKVPRAHALKSMYPFTSQKCPYISKIAFRFSEVSFSFSKMSYYFPELLLPFPQLFSYYLLREPFSKMLFFHQIAPSAGPAQRSLER